MDHWRYVGLVTVRNLHTGFIGEARFHAHAEVGEIKESPAEALESAAMKLADARRAMQPKKTDDWEDLL